jgi:hypothetical protein
VKTRNYEASHYVIFSVPQLVHPFLGLNILLDILFLNTYSLRSSTKHLCIVKWWRSYFRWRWLYLCRQSLMYEGVSRSVRTESITKYTLTTIKTRWEATQRVMVAKITRLTHKITIQLHLVAENCTICSSRSRRKLLDTYSYVTVLSVVLTRKSSP